jgi:hypothetical protein
MQCPKCKSRLQAIKQPITSCHDYQLVCPAEGTHYKWASFKEVMEHNLTVVEHSAAKSLF